MSNKLKILLITLLLLFSTVTVTLGKQVFFTDVKENAWYYKDVKSLHDKGIINGYSDGTFRPNENVTRAEVSKMINSLIEYYEKSDNTLPTVETFDKHFINLVAKVVPSVVKVTTYKTDGSKSGGTGFIIKGTEESKNHILTNHHVVENASRIEIQLNNGKTYDASILMTEEFNDLALLSIPEEDQLKYLEMTSEVSRGQSIVIIGHPLGLSYSVSKGVVSHTSSHRGWLQIDASINSGSSGSPVLNSHAQVVGIVHSKLVGEGIEGLSFATKSDDIILFLVGK